MKPLGHLRLGVIVALALALAPLGCATYSTVGRTSEGAEVVQISLSLSNAYLVKSKKPILIDTGSDGDLFDLTGAIEASGVTMNDVGLMVVTHAHSDHAGQAAELRRMSRAKIMIGAGDLGLVREGHNDELKPLNATAYLLKQCVVPYEFAAFEPDHVVEGPVGLEPWGIDGKVMPMPGHTTGSLVVLLSNRAAFVGDMILGGAFGGAIDPHSPGEHYFHADREQNQRNIAELVKIGVETFYLGHGGPVARADVLKAFDLDSAGSP